MKLFHRDMLASFNYYYLVPSLPTLRPEDSGEISCDVFLQKCSQFLTSDDLESLRHSTIDNFDPQSPNTVFRKWQQWETDLRNQLIVLRCQKLRLDPKHFTRAGTEFIQISRSVKEAFAASTPMESENYLHKLRWAYLDDMERSYLFDLNYLIIYYVKLQLLERRKKYTLERGMKFLEEMGVLEENLL